MRAAPNYFHVDEIFEIRLLPETWVKIRETAFAHDLTYSWIVRMCLFKLQAQGYKRDQESHLLYRKVNRAYIWNEKPLHRHQLCLYGADGHYLGMMAAYEGFTISMLIRIALEMFLTQVISELAAGADPLATGVKIFQSVRDLRSPVTKFHNKQLLFKPFPRQSFWPYKPIVRFPWHIPR